MLKRILYLINQFSLSGSLMRVNQLFIVQEKETSVMKLHNNFVFQHACMTPLSILSCSLENASVSNSAHELKHALKSAQEATKRLTQLIKSVTKQEQEECFFLISTAISEVLLLFKQKYNCEIAYTSFLPKNIKLFGNKLYFQEVLVCLLNNAYEAHEGSKEAHISFVVKIVSGSLSINIVDFAKGMSSLAQKMALIEGVSYKEKGLGLGLFFTKQTIESQFGGELNISSRLGMGTHVQVVLPIPVPKPYSQSLAQS